MTVIAMIAGTLFWLVIFLGYMVSFFVLLKGGFDTFANVLVAQMLNIGMSEESYAMAGIMSILSIAIIGSILIYSMARSERLERERRIKAQPLMSQ